MSYVTFWPSLSECRPALDRAYVDENILAAAVRLNEAETLLGVEPFDRA
jgi:hypothetical protein